MSRTLDLPARQVVTQGRSHRLLAAGLAAVVASGGVAIALSRDDAPAPANRPAAARAPMILGDPPVAKGARGDRRSVPVLPVFRDSALRKGAGGR